MENNAQLETLLEKGYACLASGDWLNAKTAFDEALSLDNRCAKAYIGQLMAELNVHSQEELSSSKTPLDGNASFNKALSYADEKYREELVQINKTIKDRMEASHNETAYSMAVFAMSKAHDDVGFQSAAAAFDRILSYKDSAKRKEECLAKASECKKESIYQRAKEALNENTASSLKDAIDYLKRIPGYKDADELLASHSAEKMMPKEEPKVKEKVSSQAVLECPSLIVCPEEKNLVAYKHPASCFNMGAVIDVKPNQMALFMEKDMRIGVFMPGKAALNDDNVSYDIKKDSNSDEKFFCDCYFVNMISSKNIKWKGLATVTTATEEGNKYFDAQLIGRFSYEVTDPAKFLTWALRYLSFDDGKVTVDDLNGMVKATMTSSVKSNFNKVMDRKIKDMDTIRKNLPAINDDLTGVLNAEMQKMGILLSELKITEINMYSADKAVPDKAQEEKEEEKETPGKKRLRTGLIIGIPVLAAIATGVILFVTIGQNKKNPEPTTSSVIAETSSVQSSYSYNILEDSSSSKASAWEDYIANDMQKYLSGNTLPFVDLGDPVVTSWNNNEEALYVTGTKAVNSALVNQTVTAFVADGYKSSSKTSTSVKLTHPTKNLQVMLFAGDTGTAQLKAYYYETFDPNAATSWSQEEEDAFEEVINGHEVPHVYLGLKKNTVAIHDLSTMEAGLKSVSVRGGLWDSQITSLAETAFQNASWTTSTVKQDSGAYTAFYGYLLYGNITFGSYVYSDMTVHAAVAQNNVGKALMVVSFQNKFDDSSATGSWNDTFVTCVDHYLDKHTIPYFFMGKDEYDIYWNSQNSLMTVRALNAWDDQVKELAATAFDAAGGWTKTSIDNGYTFETSYDDLHKLTASVHKELTSSGYNTLLEVQLSKITPDQSNYTGTYTHSYTTEELTGNIIHNDDLVAANAIQNDTLVLNDDGTYSFTKLITSASENISLSYVFTGKYTITGTKAVRLGACMSVTWSENWGNYVSSKNYVNGSGSTTDQVKPFGDDGDFYLPSDFFGSNYYYAPANPTALTTNTAKVITLDRSEDNHFTFTY